MLGQSHAENDQDRLAISCLERAVEMDPYSLDALLVSMPRERDRQARKAVAQTDRQTDRMFFVLDVVFRTPRPRL